MTTSVDRDENRMSTEDKARVRNRIASTIEEWAKHSTLNQQRADNGLATLIRLGAHSLGCSLHELRRSEIEWIETQAREALRTAVEVG